MLYQVKKKDEQKEVPKEEEPKPKAEEEEKKQEVATSEAIVNPTQVKKRKQKIIHQDE